MSSWMCPLLRGASPSHEIASTTCMMHDCQLHASCRRVVQRGPASGAANTSLQLTGGPTPANQAQACSGQAQLRSTHGVHGMHDVHQDTAGQSDASEQHGDGDNGTPASLLPTDILAVIFTHACARTALPMAAACACAQCEQAILPFLVFHDGVRVHCKFAMHTFNIT